MNRIIFTYLLLTFAVCSPLLGQADSLGTDQSDSVAVDIEIPVFKAIPWAHNASLGTIVAISDSLWRWQLWPDWTYKRNRDPGAITFRLGTAGRSSAILRYAHEPRHQLLFWGDLPMNDPVSGSINWNVLPQHKIDVINEDQWGVTHESSFYLKRYYVNKPLSRLIFDESKFERRALEFWLTQNFSQKFNAEISYWDRRGGGGYPNSSFTGRQIFGKMYYQPDNRQLLELHYLNGRRTLEEPFGYLSNGLEEFDFDRFTAIPNQPNAESESGLSTLGLFYHLRSRDTTVTREHFRAGIFRQKVEREVSYSADTTGHNTRSLGAFLHKWVDLNFLKLEGRVSYQAFENVDSEETSLTIEDWRLLTTKGKALFEPADLLHFRSSVSYNHRDDGFSSYTASVGAELNLWDQLFLDFGASRGSVIPTPQQLYWSSDEYNGDPGLENEKIDEIYASAESQLSNSLMVGTKGEVKEIRDGIMIGSGGSFVNIDRYTSLSSTGYMAFESTHIEVSASATLQRYQDLMLGSPQQVQDFSTERVWVKGGVHWKGYLFNGATYVKTGVWGMISPKRYLPDRYIEPLDYWQPSGSNHIIPGFHRVDIDLSARVRSIMFLLRFENVLDDLTQAGYFETAGYPMPPRRFIFGVRALFNN